jgi:hypothetical protein
MMVVRDQMMIKTGKSLIKESFHCSGRKGKYACKCNTSNSNNSDGKIISDDNKNEYEITE